MKTTHLWTIDSNGQAAALLTRQEEEAAESAKQPLFGSLAGCVAYGGVQATAFEKPVSVEPVWNGEEVLNNGFKTQGLVPCGFRSSMMILATPETGLLTRSVARHTTHKA